MVSTTYYPDGRRYSRADPTYVYPDRQPRHHSHSSEARTSTMTERENDADTPPRKRIAVACGRCRKRKIRCSGDTGNGLPCQNCKAASAESCMFLRVASQEAPWVQSTEAFPYDLKTARTYAHSALASPLTTSPSHHYASDIHDGSGLSRYPPNSAGYYGGKYYNSVATMPSWSATPGYSDDGSGAVDYGPAAAAAAAATMGYPYQYHGQDAGLYYRVTAAAKAAAAASSAAGDLYVNTDAAAGYGYGSNGAAAAAAALVHRPTATAVQTEGHAFSLSNVAASLPHTSGPGGGDRLLPNPASRLPAGPVAAASVSSYAASTSTKSSDSPTPQPSPSSDVTTSYATSGPAGSGNYETSPISAYPPPALTLPSMTQLQQQQQQQQRLSNAEMGGYPPSTTNGGGGGSESIFGASEASLRSQGSPSDLSYKYTDASSAPSSSGACGGRRGSDETSTSATTTTATTTGSLSNGQQYTVTTPSPSMYAAVGHHGRHHIGQYMLSEDVAAEHHLSHHHLHHQHSGRRSACGLSVS
ncbi:hypothetical protein CORC01_07514 [Colletotrichum orchidophilum]|uniref:Zn(2)-C6 fungal-type domain-containing protein n=1 Tax=Colletotrichum orchidophilum TaxID=1209926 RepID=A0A1G4B735_9PEZI|nr:uncharacterized protein CORC01_07514 [Colletotrichum orchidophilum]OHE97260.1 hypothetical protein CORC01_07514 [Colletotrichum orchidophilum]